MTIIEGTNASQNVRLDYSNTAITIVQGVDITQNTNIAVIQGVNASKMFLSPLKIILLQLFKVLM
jgi:hypothetical protein